MITFVSIKFVDVFDFSALYTNLDLALVNDALFSVIDNVFSSYNTFLCIRFDESFFCQKKIFGF